MIRPKLYATVKDGKLVFEPAYQSLFEVWLMRFEGKNVEVSVTTKTRDNTPNQQRYYRGVVVPFIAQQIGESNDRTHEILQAKFFVYYRDDGLSYIRSTAIGEWSTVEWEEKMQEIREWAHDWFSSEENPSGLQIPLPNEIVWD